MWLDPLENVLEHFLYLHQRLLTKSTLTLFWIQKLQPSELLYSHACLYLVETFSLLIRSKLPYKILYMKPNEEEYTFPLFEHLLVWQMDHILLLRRQLLIAFIKHSLPLVIKNLYIEHKHYILLRFLLFAHFRY